VTQEVVSVEKNVCIREEEVLLVNGTPITLEGEEGRAIKECLLKGTIPNQDLINHLLLKVQQHLLVSGSVTPNHGSGSFKVAFKMPTKRKCFFTKLFFAYSFPKGTGTFISVFKNNKYRYPI
jgi:hypothetical protein